MRTSVCSCAACCAVGGHAKINVSRRKVPLEVLGSPRLGSSPAFSPPFADASCASLGVADGGGWLTAFVFGRFRLRRCFFPLWDDADDPGVRTGPTGRDRKYGRPRLQHPTTKTNTRHTVGQRHGTCESTREGVMVVKHKSGRSPSQRRLPCGSLFPAVASTVPMAAPELICSATTATWRSPFAS